MEADCICGTHGRHSCAHVLRDRCDRLEAHNTELRRYVREYGSALPEVMGRIAKAAAAGDLEGLKDAQAAMVERFCP